MIAFNVFYTKHPKDPAYINNEPELKLRFVSATEDGQNVSFSIILSPSDAQLLKDKLEKCLEALQ